MDERFSADRFSDLRQTIPGALFDIRYAGNNNFTGVPVPGYYAPVALLSVPAAEAEERRNILLDAMTSSGFIPYEREWWHYQLADEPYPDTCWDFDITEDMFRQ